jgi:hypothetical protein
VKLDGFGVINGARNIKFVVTSQIDNFALEANSCPKLSLVGDDGFYGFIAQFYQ